MQTVTVTITLKLKDLSVLTQMDLKNALSQAVTDNLLKGEKIVSLIVA